MRIRITKRRGSTLRESSGYKKYPVSRKFKIGGDDYIHPDDFDERFGSWVMNLQDEGILPSWANLEYDILETEERDLDLTDIDPEMREEYEEYMETEAGYEEYPPVQIVQIVLEVKDRVPMEEVEELLKEIKGLAKEFVSEVV